MIFFSSQHTLFTHFEEEEEAGIDDALLGELDDETLEDALLEDGADPLLGEEAVAAPGLEDPSDEERLFEDDDEEDMDYDSFDDHDEL